MERRTESRLSVDLPGSYQSADGPSRSMFFSQMSSKGCRLQAYDLDLATGDGVELFLGPVGPIAGTVRWAGGNAAGVEFHTALDSAIVGYFAAFINDVA
jgi:hypothetical protein